MSGEVNRAEEAISNFEKTNGTKVKDVNTKELLLILHKELADKIDKHIKWSGEEDRRVIKALNDHDVLFQKITNVLPEKGFCEQVNNELWPKKQPTLASKVNELWHQRKYIKGIFITITSVLYDINKKLKYGNIIIRFG